MREQCATEWTAATTALKEKHANELAEAVGAAQKAQVLAFGVCLMLQIKLLLHRIAPVSKCVAFVLLDVLAFCF
jgi:hypothetical protein